jgi:uncharacterized protein (DUF305 family)
VVEVNTETDHELELLPWWKSPLNIILMGIVAILAAGSVGFSIGRSDSVAAHNNVDTGFLQDMRIHHEQAVTMSVVYLGASPKGNLLLNMIAKEIMFAQSAEGGRMVQMLRMFGEAETNESDIAMSWMGMPTPLDEMMGMASSDEMDTLYKSRGEEADKIFATLMIAHHKGGLHMAEYAKSNAKNKEVIAFADSIIQSQESEIYELEKALSQLT